MRQWDYVHFWQNDPKLLEALKSRFPQYRGICWFACLVMAVDAVLSRLRLQAEEIPRRLYRATFLTTLEELDAVIFAISEAGVDIDPLRERGHAVFLDNRSGGGGDMKFIRENPELFGEYLMELLRALGGLPVECRVRVWPEDEFPCNIWSTLALDTEQGWASVLAVKMKHGEGESNHAVFLGGTEDHMFTVSDPNLQNPIQVGRSMFEHVCVNWAPIGGVSVKFGGMALQLRYTHEHWPLELVQVVVT